MEVKYRLILIVMVLVAVSFVYSYTIKESEYLAYVPNAGDGTISVIDVQEVS